MAQHAAPTQPRSRRRRWLILGGLPLALMAGVAIALYFASLNYGGSASKASFALSWKTADNPSAATTPGSGATASASFTGQTLDIQFSNALPTDAAVVTGTARFNGSQPARLQRVVMPQAATDAGWRASLDLSHATGFGSSQNSCGLTLAANQPNADITVPITIWLDESAAADGSTASLNGLRVEAVPSGSYSSGACS